MKFIFVLPAIMATAPFAAAASNLRASSKSQPTAVSNAEAHRKLYLCDTDCTGDNVGVPVDVNGAAFTDALADYFNTGASVYGNKVNCWDTSQVTDMNSAYGTCSGFDMDDPINCWDTSKVTDMTYMFSLIHFDQDISSWDVSSVTSMDYMFAWNSVFNQPLNAWNVTSLVTATNMFEGQKYFRSRGAFNQSLCTWGSKATELTQSGAQNMFYYTSCPGASTPTIGDPTSSWCGGVCFGEYYGEWVNVGSNAQEHFTAGASWSQSQSSTYTSSFESSLTASAEEEAGFMGSDVKLTESATETMSTSVSNTMGTAETTSWSFTCDSIDCTNGVIYQWYAKASASDGTDQEVRTCNFSCVPQTIHATPKCPLDYCSDASCQCCNAPWISGNSDPDANHLIPSAGGSCTTSFADVGAACSTDEPCASGSCGDDGICHENDTLVQQATILN